MLCVRGQAAADGCTYIIKNRDMGMPMEQALVRHIYPDGQEIIEVGGAGILTYPAVGINSHGLAVTTTGFWTEKDPTRIDRVEEADIFLNVRVLLSSCRTAAQAVEFCRTAPRMNGLNVIAADPTEAYVIEMTSDEIYVEKDEGRGVLFRTNHVVSDQLSHFNPPESVLQQMQDSRRGGKQTSLLMGRRLDSHALFRTDSRVFYKNALPNEMPALCVGLLLDESGSMSWNDRATYARSTAIILYDFCQALGIPITVYGHSTSDRVDLYSYAEFEAIDRDDRYRMMDISARGSNRDGAALRYVAEKLVRRPEDIKLLMLVSDGQPADYNYYGTAAEEDLRGIKHEYQRKGIIFVAAAIGADKENIERIYGDAYLDITDLTKLPIKLAGIIKQFIRF